MASKAVVEAFAGGMGSLVSLLVTYPLKTIYTLQAINQAGPKARAPLGPALSFIDRPGQPVTVAQLLANISRLLDLRGLYAGLQPAAVETATSSAIYFYLYSILRQAVVEGQHRQRQRQQSTSATAVHVDSRNENIGVLASLLVAALAGAGNQLITTPAQVVTTQMQAMHRRQRLRESEGERVDYGECGTCAIARQVYVEDGLRGFWRGIVPSLLLVVNPAIQYMLYEWMIASVLRSKAVRGAARGGGKAAAPAVLKMSAGETFLVGALSKIGATIATYPMIVVKARLQAVNKETHEDMQYSSTWHAMRRIYTDEGMHGYFKGMNAKIVQTALSAALMLMIRERVYYATEGVLRAVVELPGQKDKLKSKLVTAGLGLAVAASASK